VTEHAIMFQAPMIRAILAGKKTQTRRIVNWSPREDGLNLAFSGLEPGYYSSDNPSSGYVLRSRGYGACWNDRTWPAHCPYGSPGDRMWVRETFSTDALTVYPCPTAWYRADFSATEPDGNHSQDCGYSRLSGSRPPLADCFACAMNGRRFKWRSPIFMPRRLSRITLQITEVRLQRLKEITEDDAQAEGIPVGEMMDVTVNGEAGRAAFFKARDAFAHMWNGIHRAHEWKTNPWVWALTFRRI